MEKRQLILMVLIKVLRTDQKSFKVNILHMFFPKNVKILVEENALALVFAQLLRHFVIEVTSSCYHWNQKKKSASFEHKNYEQNLHLTALESLKLLSQNIPLTRYIRTMSQNCVDSAKKNRKHLITYSMNAPPAFNKPTLTSYTTNPS